jgi:hypothetical protein
VLVDVVRLRRHGEKLPAEEIAVTRPVRGELTLSSRNATRSPDGSGHLLVTSAMLARSGTTFELLPGLTDVHVTRLRDDSMVIVGREIVTGSAHTSWQGPQAWWCRLVRDGSAPEPVRRGRMGLPV